MRDREHQAACAHAAALEELAAMPPSELAEIKAWAQTSALRSWERVTVELLRRIDDVEAIKALGG